MKPAQSGSASQSMKPGLQLWRGFFPSWKFFDEVGYVPSLQFRVARNEVELESKEWQPLLQKAHRRWLDLFLNPFGNSLHFTDTLVRQFAEDIQSGDSPEQIEHAISFKIVFNLVQQEVKKYLSLESDFYFQFKVVMTPILESSRKDERESGIILISSIYRGS